MKSIMLYLLALMLALLWPQMASAQNTPTEPVEGHRGAAYVSYGYAQGSAASLDNLQFDVDVVRTQARCCRLLATSPTSPVCMLGRQPRIRSVRSASSGVTYSSSARMTPRRGPSGTRRAAG